MIFKLKDFLKFMDTIQIYLLFVLRVKIKLLVLILLSLIYLLKINKTNGKEKNISQIKQRHHLYFHWQRMINFNSNINNQQFVEYMIKVQLYLEMISLAFAIHQIQILVAVQKSMIICKVQVIVTPIKNIKLMMNNHILD
jgi:hypothetical protein